MDPLLSTFLILTGMAAVVLLFRAFVQRPQAVLQEDAPGVRTVVTFRGQDPMFLEEDGPESSLVGTRLFVMLCEGLGARGFVVEDRGRLQNAHRAYCRVEGQSFAVVLEWTEEAWIVGVDWVPASAAQQRHLELTHQVFAPHDSHALRQVLRALDGWLKGQPSLSRIVWHRKERWIAEDASDGSEWPVEGE